jgi:hypothetical protein
MDMDAQERAMVAEHFACWKSRQDGARDADPAIKSNRGLAGEVYPMRAVARAATTSS